MSKRASIQSPDEFDILSAIWILSCNDENSTITFEGIKHRLGLSENYDIRSLVKSRGEMFRPGVPQRRLTKWKQELLEGKQLPSWIREIEDEAERKTVIENLKPDDVFRNQFRAEVDSPRAPIEIIEWGLEHIDRLRKVNAETREEKIKKWTGMWIPILSTLVALAAVVSGAYLQLQTLNTQKVLQDASLAEQRSLKYYEVELKPRQEGYSLFMQSLNEAYYNASKNDANALNTSLRQMESIYYDIEPFLSGSRGDWRTAIWTKYQEFAAATNGLKDQPAGTSEYKKLDSTIQEQKDYFRSELHQALFNP